MWKCRTLAALSFTVIPAEAQRAKAGSPKPEAPSPPAMAKLRPSLIGSPATPLMVVLVCGVGQGCQHFGVLSDQPHKSAARQKEGGKILSCSTCAKQSIGSFKAFSYLLNP